MIKGLRELISIGNELDLRGLVVEAGLVDKVIKKIAEYDILDHKDNAPEVLSALKSFIGNHLNPETSVDPATDEKVADMLYNGSRDLHDYIVEFLPDAIYTKALELNIPSKAFYDHLVDELRFDERYKDGSDFKFLTEAFAHYLDDYEF